MTRHKKLIIVPTLLLTFLLFIGFGVYRDEVIDVITNATLLCYSCIGIK